MANISQTQEVEGVGTRVAQKRFNPLEMLELRKVVLKRGKKIKLRNRTFTLTYTDDSVWYRPENGFVPCGWLSIKRIENYLEDMEQ